MGKEIPVHVSAIMDGNGRWAKKQGKERMFGHLHGADSVRSLVEACVDYGVKYLSLYAFSEENWNRPQEEVSFLMSLMQDTISKELETFVKNGIRFRVLGNLDRLNPFLRESISKMEEITAGNDRMTLIVFLSYSGKWDILQAAKKMAAEHPGNMNDMTMEDFDSYLVTAGVPDPDLIIRTSGEQRISNYLLWQGAYSELYFTDTLWPDFDREEFKKALDSYALRDRRYGKVK